MNIFKRKQEYEQPKQTAPDCQHCQANELIEAQRIYYINAAAKELLKGSLFVALIYVILKNSSNL